jgi:hypothetical protein
VRSVFWEVGTGGLLRFVTSLGMPVVLWASARLGEVIREGWPQAPPEDVRLLAESLVRLAISYVTAPSGPPETMAVQASELLGPFIERALGS